MLKKDQYWLSEIPGKGQKLQCTQCSKQVLSDIESRYTLPDKVNWRHTHQKMEALSLKHHQPSFVFWKHVGCEEIIFLLALQS